ncbi:MAG: hypothetical protein ACFFA5_07965 [Promethearchaeota archaeon]
MKITDKRFEETIERRVIVEEKIKKRVIEKSLEERVEMLELKFAEYVFLSDSQIKEIRDLIQLYYDIYDNKRIWSILRNECEFSKLERVPRYKFPLIKKILYDFVGSHEPKQEDHPNAKQNYFLGDNGKIMEEKCSFLANKKKKYHKKRVVDTSGCPSILSFTFEEQ